MTLTLPADFPHLVAHVITPQVSQDSLFVSPFLFPPSLGTRYLLILDNAGQPIYYRRFPNIFYAVDFKLQSNGMLTYFDAASQVFHALDTSYTEVKTYRAGNGYVTDLHDLQVLPNGHALIMIYDPQRVDMSKVVPGGDPNATVIGLVLQELDTRGQVVFEWRSWDHFQITDTYESLTATTIDYSHGNAVHMDTDGNILLSSRHMSEITKINRATGDIMWRLGGKNSDFTFTNTQPFVYQHDIRRLPNGNVSLFDNRTGQGPQYSRGIELSLDLAAMTATLVKDYRNAPDTYSVAMGSNQLLSNGNRLIGWGASNTTMVTEFAPDGTKVFELLPTVELPLSSYRAFRFPWHATPAWPPTVVVQAQTGATQLNYSWNGATEVAAYHIYGGPTPTSMTLLMIQAKTGFEDTSSIPETSPPTCFYQVVPVDTSGKTLRASDVVVNPISACQTIATATSVAATATAGTEHTATSIAATATAGNQQTATAVAATATIASAHQTATASAATATAASQHTATTTVTPATPAPTASPTATTTVTPATPAPTTSPIASPTRVAEPKAIYLPSLLR